jgi:peptidoglycan-associated lipoprotein
MNLSSKITVYAVAMASLLVGCAYQRSVTLSPTGLPEEIFATPQQNNYSTSNVILFKFTEPSFAPEMGKEAAQCLYQELLKNRVFLNVTRELGVTDIRIEELVEIARSKKYDLLITGDLLYWLEGSLHEPARADEQIRVIDVSTNRTLWYAKAVDIGTPAPYADYIFIEGRGARAPTARTLLKRNAEKFCKMLLNSPPQERSAPARTHIEFSEHEGESAPSVVPAEEGPQKKRLSAGQESRAAQKALEEQRLREERAERERFLNEHIYFELDKSRLLPEAKEILGRKAKWLAAHPEVSVIIEGHCDERGTNTRNMELGHRRAQSARNCLVDLGIVPERLTTVSYGRQRPLDPGHNEAAWAKNRRAEFVTE